MKAKSTNRRLRLAARWGCAALVAVGIWCMASAVEAVEITEGQLEGIPQFVVRTEAATWYYDRPGGGFSRLIDREGRDWIAFSKDPLSEFPASAAAGYRGLPNLLFGGGNPDAGAGHPGFDRCQSTLVGPDTIRTESLSGKWAWTWTFTETTATFTMEKADPDHAWWFLYEGPIAGTFAPRQKYWGTDRAGPRREVPDHGNQLFDRWQWIYFGDVAVQRVLFLAQHEPDDLPDTLWYLGSSEGGAATAPDGMVVFGFGRGPGTQPQFRGGGQRFTVGFLETGVGDQAQHARVAEMIEAAIAPEPATATRRPRSIDLWHGPQQTFGGRGEPQRWINVLGNVAPWSEVERLTYSVNGGSHQPLTLGTDLRRLAAPGDFNVQRAWDELRTGENLLALAATYQDGEELTAEATLDIARGQSWRLPYHVDFAQVDDLQEVVQVVDGHWRLTDDGVRTVHPWYDRVLTLGDSSWTDYEAVVRLSVHGFTPPQRGPPTFNVTHMGVALRWRGHTVDGLQPSRRWYPLGAQGELLLLPDPPQCRWRVVLGAGVVTQPGPAVPLTSPMWIKAQVESLEDGRTRYRFKNWPDGGEEPPDWGAEAHKPPGAEYPSGSLCLVPHNADVTIHEVSVQALTEAPAGGRPQPK